MIVTLKYLQYLIAKLLKFFVPVSVTTSKVLSFLQSDLESLISLESWFNQIHITHPEIRLAENLMWIWLYHFLSSLIYFVYADVVLSKQRAQDFYIFKCFKQPIRAQLFKANDVIS